MGIILFNTHLCRSMTCHDVFWLIASPLYLPFLASPLIATFVMHRVTEPSGKEIERVDLS